MFDSDDSDDCHSYLGTEPSRDNDDFKMLDDLLEELEHEHVCHFFYTWR